MSAYLGSYAGWDDGDDNEHGAAEHVGDSYPIWAEGDVFFLVGRISSTQMLQVSSTIISFQV